LWLRPGPEHISRRIAGASDGGTVLPPDISEAQHKIRFDGIDALRCDRLAAGVLTRLRRLQAILFAVCFDDGLA